MRIVFVTDLHGSTWKYDRMPQALNSWGSAIGDRQRSPIAINQRRFRKSSAIGDKECITSCLSHTTIVLQILC